LRDYGKIPNTNPNTRKLRVCGFTSDQLVKTTILYQRLNFWSLIWLGSLYKSIPKVWGQTLGERREKTMRNGEKMEENEHKTQISTFIPLPVRTHIRNSTFCPTHLNTPMARPDTTCRDELSRLPGWTRYCPVQAHQSETHT
jgi:hypothetical protein